MFYDFDIFIFYLLGIKRVLSCSIFANVKIGKREKSYF